MDEHASKSLATLLRVTRGDSSSSDPNSARLDGYHASTVAAIRSSIARADRTQEIGSARYEQAQALKKVLLLAGE